MNYYNASGQMDLSDRIAINRNWDMHRGVIQKNSKKTSQTSIYYCT